MLRQLLVVSLLNLRNLRHRLRSSAVAVIGFAGVVAVFVSLLAVEQGFSAAMRTSGAADVAFVTKSGAQTELNSVLARDEVARVSESAAAREAGGIVAASREVLVIVNLPKRGGDEVEANVSFRGIEPTAFDVHRKMRMVAGRRFQPGLNEIIVGRGVADNYKGLELGSSVRWGQYEWTVVGIFTSDGDAYESEIWTDAKVLQTAYQRGDTYQSMRVVLADPAGLDRFKAALEAEPGLGVSVQRESEYFAAQSEFQAKFISMAGKLMSALMAIGAIFGAMNTMHGAVAARQQEIATLRALGFDSGAVLISVLVEAALLGLLGGGGGAALAYSMLNGNQISTMSVESFSQVVFAFSVTPEVTASGVFLAVILGLVGGLLPAWQAARLPISHGLRQL